MAVSSKFVGVMLVLLDLGAGLVVLRMGEVVHDGVLIALP